MTSDTQTGASDTQNNESTSETSLSDVNTQDSNSDSITPSASDDANSAAAEAATNADDVANDIDGEQDQAAEATAKDANTNPNLKWYVVHTYSMLEDRAKINLLESIKTANMEERFGEIFVPKTSQERVLKSGKKKRVEKTSFPGYILVQMDMDQDTNGLVRATPKVTGFVGNQRNPRPISEQEVLKLTSPEQVEEQVKQQASTLTFEKGETVKVVDGAFTNFDGLVDDVQADKMKLRILVSIFGRETPVELDYSQVKKIT